MTIREEIEAERDRWRSLGVHYGSWLMQEFILRNGQEFTAQTLPKRFKMRVPKACFWNAQRLARASKRLRYVEGYVLSGDIGILIHHAWCADPEGLVIDTTLSDWQTGESRSADARYFGIVFEKQWWACAGGSVLDSQWGMRIETWLKFDPSFKERLDEMKAAV